MRKKWKEQHGEKDRQRREKTGVVQEELGNMLIREKEQWVVRVDESNKQRRAMRKELQVKQGRRREEEKKMWSSKKWQEERTLLKEDREHSVLFLQNTDRNKPTEKIYTHLFWSRHHHHPHQPTGAQDAE